MVGNVHSDNNPIIQYKCISMNNGKQVGWTFWIDTGGTFTDCFTINPEGQRQSLKVLSSGVLRGVIKEQTGPGQYLFQHQWPIDQDIFAGYSFKLLTADQQQTIISAIDFTNQTITLEEDLGPLNLVGFEITNHEEAPVLAIRLATKTSIENEFPPLSIRLGTTKGTNALLEKKGAPVTLLISEGFRDLVEIGTQQRPDLFQLGIPSPDLLYNQVFEVAERIDATGAVIKPLDLNHLKSVINQIEHEVVAVSTLHAYLNPEHELQIEEALKKQGFQYISLSHRLSPTLKILPRTQTALVNAYLAPVMQQYLDRIKTQIKIVGGQAPDMMLMTSGGGLQPYEYFRPKDSLLSGPAGGVVGAAKLASALSMNKVITLDMGGTSTDTARFDGHFDYRFTTKIGEIEMASPSIAIDTVAAGGGSICSFDGKKLTVGPESAGAIPGPACYGAGGPLTVTDVNLLLGKFDPQMIGIPITDEPAMEALMQVKTMIEATYNTTYEPLELLRGFEQIANQKMAESIRKISVAKGFNTNDYRLMAYGGAGAMHACKIAELLRIQEIIVPFNGGLFSAWGIGQADIERISTHQINQKLVLMHNRLEGLIDQLTADAHRQLVDEIGASQSIETKSIRCYLRFEGQESCLEVRYHHPDQLIPDFKEAYLHLFGHYPTQHSIELESIKIIVGTTPAEDMAIGDESSPFAPEPHYTFKGQFEAQDFPVYNWTKLSAGAQIKGPAIVLNGHASLFLEPNWQFTILPSMDAVMNVVEPTQLEEESQKEAIELELFTNKFTAIAEEMGAQLQRTAFSVNVKERLDFSCALLDPNGYLLVNAPHIPVHLGSLGICARLVKEAIDIGPGDVVLTNHPKYGGSHLPDLTMMAGVFDDQDTLIGYVINRAHHAEIGGKRPGSMPPDAKNLEEEGVVILPTYLVKGGTYQWEAIEDLMMGGEVSHASLTREYCRFKCGSCFFAIWPGSPA